MNFLKSQKYKIIIIAVVLLLAGGALFIMFRHYPIASVNGSYINASEFDKNYAAANYYYGNYKKVNGESAATVLSQSDIETQVLSQMIDAKLIDQAVRKEVGGDLDALLLNKMAEYDKDQNLAKATETVYGMSYSDFKTQALIPQAEKDILSGRLFIKNQNIDDFMKGLEKSAQVSIFSNNLAWDGQKVVVK